MKLSRFLKDIKHSSLEPINFVTRFFLRFVDINAFALKPSLFFLTHCSKTKLEAYEVSTGRLTENSNNKVRTPENTSYPYYFDVNDLFGQKEFAYFILNEKLYKLSIVENGQMKLIDETK